MLRVPLAPARSHAPLPADRQTLALASTYREHLATGLEEMVASVQVRLQHALVDQQRAHWFAHEHVHTLVVRQPQLLDLAVAHLHSSTGISYERCSLMTFFPDSVGLASGKPCGRTTCRCCGRACHKTICRVLKTCCGVYPKQTAIHHQPWNTTASLNANHHSMASDQATGAVA